MRLRILGCDFANLPPCWRTTTASANAPTSNGGQASAFNAEIPECRGEVIVLLDGDDWWAPGKPRKMAQVFDEDPALGMIGHAFIESFDDGSRKTIAPSE